VRDTGSCASITEQVTEIYHLACPASPDHFDVSPIDILETCFTGTKNMLDFAVKNQAKILIASTSGEFNYGLSHKPVIEIVAGLTSHFF
jgi:nucleoside-diphosphate-sugar epimerase